MRWSEVRVFQTPGNRRSWERGREFVAPTPLGLDDPLEHGSSVGRPARTTSVVVTAATDRAAGESCRRHEPSTTAVTLTPPPPTPAIPAGGHEIPEPAADEIDARRDGRRVKLVSSPSAEIAAGAEPTRRDRAVALLDRARCRTHRLRRFRRRLRLIDGRTLDRAPRRCAGRWASIPLSGSPGAGAGAARRRGPRQRIAPAIEVLAAVGPVTRLPGIEVAQAQQEERTGQPIHSASTARSRSRAVRKPSASAVRSGSNSGPRPTQAAPRRSADPATIAAMSATGPSWAVLPWIACGLPTRCSLLG